MREASAQPKPTGALYRNLFKQMLIDELAVQCQRSVAHFHNQGTWTLVVNMPEFDFTL